jgi:hypothetical protein
MGRKHLFIWENKKVILSFALSAQLELYGLLCVRRVDPYYGRTKVHQSVLNHRPKFQKTISKNKTPENKEI